jgi:hypothetical protein
MSEHNIWLFIKFFQNEAWATDFMKGKIYLNRLSYFRRIESLYDDNNRLDTNEAVAAWL